MVRTYKPKNRYCKKTKLSERAFLSIYHSYIDGLSASQAHRLICKTDELDVKVSRQAVEGIYLRLGKYLWVNFVRPKIEKLYVEYGLADECESASHFIVYYLDMMRQAIEGEIDYKAYRKDGIEIGNMETVLHLIERSKKFNGLPYKTFHLHFAYVSFIETMKSEITHERFSMDDVKIMLLHEFTKHPI